MNAIAATTITAGQTFTTKHNTLTAIESPKVDRYSVSGGYKVLCKDEAGETMYWLFTASETVTA